MSKIHVGKIRLGEKDWKVGVLKDYLMGIIFTTSEDTLRELGSNSEIDENLNIYIR